MPEFPKNPLAGLQPLRDEAGRNRFADSEPTQATVVEPGTGAAAPADSSPYAVPVGPAMRPYQAGDFDMLLVSRVKRAIVLCASSLAISLSAWFLGVICVLLVFTRIALFIFPFWFLLALVLAITAVWIAQSDLRGVRLGALSAHDAPRLRLALVVGLIASLIAIAGGVTAVLFLTPFV